MPKDQSAKRQPPPPPPPRKPARLLTAPIMPISHQDLGSPPSAPAYTENNHLSTSHLGSSYPRPKAEQNPKIHLLSLVSPIPSPNAFAKGDNDSDIEAFPTAPSSKTMPLTRYVEMLLELDHIPRLHGVLASMAVWLTLAGFVVFPATFTSFQLREARSQQSGQSANTTAGAGGELGAKILGHVRNAQLLAVAAVCCGLGVLGSAYLWRRHRRNYYWLNSKIFLPSLMNSAVGLVSTLVQVYGVQRGQFSVTARATLCVTAVLTLLMSCFFGVYNFWLLQRVRKRHERQMMEFRGVVGGGNAMGWTWKNFRSWNWWESKTHTWAEKDRSN